MTFRIEGIVRPFAVIESEPVQRIFRRPQAEPDPDPATLEWGDGSRFILPPQSQNPGAGIDDLDGDGGTTRGIIVDWPDEFGGGEDSLRWTWTEISRETSDLRVENPQDPEQYVIVERIEQMTMQDSRSGDTVLLKFRNPGGGDGLLPPELGG